MVLINDSLTVVLAGDWNRLYIQPDWMAMHVFQKDELEIGVKGQGSDFAVTYRGNGIVVLPGQSKMIFSAMNADDGAIANLCCCLNNFIKEAHTPQPFVYGLNADFVEEEGSLFAEVLDSMSDTNAIVENGYEILSTTIERTLKCRDKIMNMESSLDNKSLKIHFNEHHAPEKDKPELSIECVKGFIEECFRILRGLGYEIEGDE